MAEPSIPIIKVSSSATILPSVKQEPLPSPMSMPPSEPIPLTSAVVKTEPEQQQPPPRPQQEPLSSLLFLPPPQPTSFPLAVVKTEPQEPQPPSIQQQEQREPEFLKSINDLASLCSAIQAFKCRFDGLREHLDFISQAIDSKFNEPEQQRPDTETEPPPNSSLSSAIEAFTCRFEELTKHLDFINQAIDSKFNEPHQEQQRPDIETETPQNSTETDSKTENTGPETDPPAKATRSEIQSLCEMMCSKGLRKYIVTHLSNVSKLREEVPAALKLAPKPDKLVFDCIGRFFLQGIKAYTKDSPMIPARQASVLALEFFLLMMGGFCSEGQFKIAADLKEEAQKGAVAWRKRLISEGGLAKASEVDARGLLLFVACFGIPKAFKIEDLGNLLRLCNLRAISDALKGSTELPDKMPAIIEAMARNGMHFEAVDVASIFGLEDKFSPKTILTFFLQESTKAFKRAKQEAQNNPVAVKKASEKQLGALKSVVQYLEDRSIDVSNLLGAWQIQEKIVKLEEEITELNKRIEDKKVIPKRKPDEMGSSSMVKSQEMKRSRFATKGSPLPKSSHINGLLEQRAAIVAEGLRSYDGLVPNSYDNAIPGHFNNRPPLAAVPQGSTIGSLTESSIGRMAGITDVGSGGMVPSMGVSSPNSYYGAHGVTGVYNKAAQIMSSSGLPYGWQQGSVRQSTSLRFGDFYGSSPSIEGFAGMPDAIDRTPADLYRFADSIGEIESYGSSSHRTGTLPTGAPVRHPPYMYK